MSNSEVKRSHQDKSLYDLKVLNFIPNQLYKAKATELFDILELPTLIKIEGELEETLFVSVILHGNEVSGFYAIQELLNQYKSNPNQKNRRSLVIFIGNVMAAKYSLRKLSDQTDFNRIWKEGSNTESYPFVSQLKGELRKLNLFAAIDIHNTSGKNPEYACITEFNSSSFLIAQNFSDYVINFIEPDTVLSRYCAQLCPSVVLECGLPGLKQGINNAKNLVNQLLNIESIEQLSENKQANVYCTDATIKINPGIKVEFSNAKFIPLEANLSLRDDIEKFNFESIEAGEVLGICSDDVHSAISIIDNQSNDITSQYLEINSNQIKITKSFTACMLTTNPQISVDDCLGYIIKVLPHYDSNV